MEDAASLRISERTFEFRLPDALARDIKAAAAAQLTRLIELAADGGHRETEPPAETDGVALMNPITTAVQFRQSLKLGGRPLPSSYVKVDVITDADSHQPVITIALNPEIETHVYVPSAYQGHEVRRVDWVSGAVVERTRNAWRASHDGCPVVPDEIERPEDPGATPPPGRDADRVASTNDYRRRAHVPEHRCGYRRFWRNRLQGRDA